VFILLYPQEKSKWFAYRNCPRDCGNIFNAQIVVVLWPNELQLIVQKITNHRIRDNYVYLMPMVEKIE